MMAKLTKVSNIGVRMLTDFNLKSDGCYAEHATTFRSYVAFIGGIKMSILLEDWSQ